MLALREYFWSAWPAPPGTLPAVGSLILLGVGRAWIIFPILWALLTGDAAAAEKAMNGIALTWWQLLCLLAGGPLLGYGASQIVRRLLSRRDESEPGEPVVLENPVEITGWSENLAQAKKCSNCPKRTKSGANLSDGRFICTACVVAQF